MSRFQLLLCARKPAGLAAVVFLLKPAVLEAVPTPYFMPPKASQATQPASVYDKGTGAKGFTMAFQNRKEVLSPRAQWLPIDLAHLSKIGPLDIERAEQSPLMEEKGMTTTFSYSVKALPGLDLTANFFGGHRDTIQGAAGGSAAITGGIRIHW